MLKLLMRVVVHPSSPIRGVIYCRVLVRLVLRVASKAWVLGLLLVVVVGVLLLLLLLGVPLIIWVEHGVELATLRF